MHSLKNTAVAVILLGISFGLYQVSLTPQGDEQKTEIEFSLAPDGPHQSLELPTVNHSHGQQTADAQTKKPAPFPAAPFPAAPELKAPDLSSLSAPLKINPSPPATPGFPAQPANFSGFDPTKNQISASLASQSKSNQTQRQPLVATTENNVQSIQYPAIADSKNHFAATAKAAIPPSPKISQRELVDPSLDAGLIDALKMQSNLDVSQNSTNQFSAQPIGTAKPQFDAAATEQAGAFTPSPNSRFDLPVQQTNDFGSAGFASGNPAAPNSSSKLIGGNASAYDQLTFKTVWPQVDQLVAAEDFHTALKLLTRFYRDETLTGPQRQRLLGWLDALAGKVIFSDEDHLAAEPYQVGLNESLTDIAAKWNVPAQLVYNVNTNALPNPVAITPGTQLKQIPGPFTAEIDLQSKVMTMFLGDLYAGRFPIRVGISGEPRPGKFEVLVKSETGHSWRDSQGVDYPPGSPENGYGPNWIGLSGSLCLHAVSDDAGDGHHGCIGLAAEDAKDVYAILAQGAELTIVR